MGSSLEAHVAFCYTLLTSARGLSPPIWMPTMPFVRRKRLRTLAAVRVSVTFLWLVGVCIGLQGCSEQQAPAVQLGEGKTGAACQGGVDCESGLCVRTEGKQGVCTQLCDPDQDTSQCPRAANWQCGMAHELERDVCLCVADADHEICGDQRDNDCDTRVDDCMMCEGKPIAPDDERHCGACGRRCVTGASCTDGVCVCANGVASPDCVQAADAPECSKGKDCDDKIGCTEDSCSEGVCKHVVIATRCAPYEVCDLSKGGCTPGRACAVDIDCHDDNPCTTNERCDPPTRVCLWDPLDGDNDGMSPRVCGGDDCNDADEHTYPGAPELCDGEDNSCDGKVDAPSNSKMCEDDQACQAGKCTCTNPSRTTCGDECPDLKTDASHCGACDRACTDSQICSNGDCIDANECALGTHDCVAPFTCVDKSGGYECRCPVGSSGPSGGPCTDVDECASASLNDCADGACKNKNNGFTCECPPGYQGDGYTCTDIDECDDVTCSGHGDCVNSTGSYACSCDFGYTPSGPECLLEDACQAGTLSGHKWCSYQCASIQDDVWNCGACNNFCGNGASCNNGKCGCEAGSGLTYCSGLKSCIDTASDEAHCGACSGADSVCPAGGVCTNGDCGCPDGLTFCQAANACVDLESDEAHCGACSGAGAVCPVGGLCTNGDCGCPGGQTVCGNTCTQLGTNADCASCGDSCAIGGWCGANGSTRACVCQSGYTDCNGTCVDLNNDESKCGSCSATACATGATCVGGDCECPANQTVCSGTCFDLSNDPLHCKTCTQTCAVACGTSGCATAKDLDARETLTCAVLSNGHVRCWGYSYYYGFGTGDYLQVSQRPVEVATLASASKVSIGLDHACALMTNGDVYCWGSSYYGQVSPDLNSYNYVLSPYLANTGFSMIVTGNYFTCGQKKDGTKPILCWGSDGAGAHGDGDAYEAISGPTSLSAVSKLAAGGDHVCALKSGKVYCWGYNGHGQVTGLESYVYAPREVSGLSGVTDISAGGMHTCAVTGGKVYCWGSGNNGQLGLGGSSSFSTPQEVLGISTAVSVTAGANHTCAVLDNKNIRCWGLGYSGQLGQGSFESLYTATGLVTGGANFTDLTLGSNYTCARNASGEVLCWGEGGGYTGTSLPMNTSTPTEITW
jgi:hypothetical protein